MRRSALRYPSQALLAFAATRVVALASTQLAVPAGGSLWQSLAAMWDPRWYQDIAVHGYDDAGDLSEQLRVDCPDTTRAGCRRTPDRYSNLAFFPLFPAAIRLMARIGIDPLVGAVVLSSAASLVAAALIALIARDIYDERAGVITVVLWGAMPVNVALSSGRPEAVFVAMAAGGLFAVSRGHPVWAAWLASLAGLTRFQAIAVIVPVVLAVWLRPYLPRTRVAVTLIAPSGLVMWLGVVAYRTGRIDGWLAVQGAWYSASDWGVGKLQFLQRHLFAGPPVFQVSAWTVVAACTLLLMCLLMRVPWPLTVYAGILLAGVLVQSSYHQHAMRFLLVAFPLLLPLAALIRRLPTWLAAAILISSCLLSAYFQMWLWSSGIDF